MVCVWFMRDDVIKVKQVGHKEEEEVEGKEEEEDLFGLLENSRQTTG